MFVGQLAGYRRKEEKWQNKQSPGNIGKLTLVHARDQDPLKRNQRDQTIAKDIVV